MVAISNRQAMGSNARFVEGGPVATFNVLGERQKAKGKWLVELGHYRLVVRR